MNWNTSSFKSVTQTQASENVGSKYKFIPTTAPLAVFENAGWVPFSISEAHARKNIGFQKHLIRLRQKDPQFTLDGEIPEIILINSHCGSSSFQIMAGVFRFACANGLIISGALFSTIKIKHIGYADQKVDNAISATITSFPKIITKVEQWKKMTLTDHEQYSFAESALLRIYSKKRLEKRKILISPTAEQILQAWRKEDEPKTLWNTLNIIQEKVMRGRVPLVLQGRSPHQASKSRVVKGIDQTVRINQALWDLAEETEAKISNN